jgi:hypothetical protein
MPTGTSERSRDDTVCPEGMRGFGGAETMADLMDGAGN